RVVEQLPPLALRAPPVVVELGRLSQEPLAQLVAFLLQRRQLVAGARRRRILRHGVRRGVAVEARLVRRGLVRGVVHACSPGVLLPISTRVTAREAPSTAAIDREYRKRVGPVTPSTPCRPSSLELAATEP